MRFSVRHITDSPLVRNSAKLLSANVMAQAIGLAIYPLLTRLYAPDDFGLLNLFMSIGSTIVLLSTAELQYAIVIPKDNQNAWKVLQCAFICLIIFTIASFLSAIFRHPISLLLGAEELATWYPFLGLYVFILGTWNILNYWYTRNEQFSLISHYQISQSVTNAGVKSLCGIIHYSGGLIIGSIFAPLFSMIINWLYLGKKIMKPYLRTPLHTAELRHTLIQYKNFPCYKLPRNLINTLSGNIPTMLLTPFFGLESVGFYSMALTLGMHPINMIANSLYQPFFQRVNQKINNHVSIASIHRQYALTMLIPLIGFGLLFPIIPILVRYLLGNGWENTATMIRIMLPWFALVLFGAPLAYIADIFQKQQLFFFLEIIGFVLRMMAIGVGIFAKNLYLSIGLMAAAASLMIIVQLVIYCILITHYERTLNREISDSSQE